MKVLPEWVRFLLAIAGTIGVMTVTTELARDIGRRDGYARGYARGLEFEQKVELFVPSPDGGSDRWACFELDAGGAQRINAKVWQHGSCFADGKGAFCSETTVGPDELVGAFLEVNP